MSKGRSKPQLELELKEAKSRIAGLEQELQNLKIERDSQIRDFDAGHTEDQQSEQKLSRLLDILPVGISILDENRQVVFQNAALQQILDISVDDLRKGTYKNRKYLDGNGSPMPADGFASVQAEKKRAAVYNVETGIVKENGATIWTDVSAVPVNFEDWKTVIVTTDITERKWAVKALLESEEKYAALFENAAVPAALTKMPEGVFVDVNQAFQSAYGYSREDVLGMTSVEIGMAQPSERAQAYQDLKNLTTLRDNERHLFTKSGEARVGLINVNKVLVSGQEYVITTIHDVTGRKQAEEKRDKLAERLDLATRSARMGIWDWDIQKNEMEWDDQMYALYGLQPCGSGKAYEAWLQGIHPEDRGPSNELSAAAVRGECEYDTEFRVLWPDGSAHWLKTNGEVFWDENGTPLRMVGINYDITERKRSQQALQQSEERFSTIFENSPIAIGISRLSDRRTILANEAFLSLYGYSRVEVIGRTTAELGIWANPEDSQHFIETLQARQRVSGMESVARKKSGEKRKALVWGEMIDINDEPCVVAQIADITEWRHAEEKLKESEERFSIAFHASPVAQAITLISAGELMAVNDAYCRLFEYSREELVGDTTISLRLWENPADREAALQELRATNHVALKEITVRTKSGQIRTALASIEPISWKGLPCVISSVIDISDRKQMEEDLRRSNSELEQFAYVASHDLQEPLRAMAGMVQLLQRRYQGQLDERADEYIGHAVDAAGRMQTLINDLLAFSRVGRRNNPIEPVESKVCLNVSLKNLDAAIRETKAVITADALPTVQADSTQLIQLLQNLIANGIKFRSGKAPQIHISAKKTEDAWQFSVRDNGIGIEPQYFERIFLVFQRLHTRREYAGTGIGLAICKKIVERHGGCIWVESTPGMGSTFYFTLPIRDQK